MRFIALFFTLLSFTSFAQQKTFSMKDVVLGQSYNLSPDGLQQLQWISTSDQFSYVEEKKGDLYLFVGHANKPKKTKSVVSLTDLHFKMKVLGKIKGRRFPRIKWISPSSFTFEHKQNIYQYNLSTESLKKTDSLELPADAKNRENVPKTNYISFTINNNLYLLKDNKVIPISENKNSDIVSGQSVSRSEFGIYKGTFWSPDGTKLAYYVKDESDVTDYPIIDWNKQPAEVNYVKYPMAGTERTERVSLHIYNTKNGKTTTVQTGAPNTQYLTNIGWDPKSEKIYIAHLNRDQNHMEMKRYDAASGTFEKLLFEEKSDKYVEPQVPPHFVKAHDDLFIWESSRSGFNHLYLYNTDGQLQKQLTQGNWEVTALNGFNKDGSKVFFTSTAISALNRDLYSVSLQGKGNSPKHITVNYGTHNISLNENGTYFIDNFSNTTTPKNSEIVNIKTYESYTLLQSDNPLEEYQLGEMRLLTVKDKKGGDLYCRIILPINFDSTKTYPVIVYLYGGPHAQMVRNTWNGGGNLWFQYMAQQGYIVWTLDNRGSGNLGKASEQNTFRQLGTVEMEDQLQGIDYLKSKPYVDANRIGIHGWSFGGFMTMSLMSRHPGIFKTGVAGGPVIDWSYYEVMYTERYMDTPEQNPEGYKNNNLLNYVDDLDGDLLIIHGTSDDVVLWQHTQLYLKEAVKKGKQVDYFVYPMHKHNVRGKDRIHLMQKVTDYFEDNLK